MKLTLKKISILSLMEKIIEVTKKFNLFKDEITEKNKNLNQKIEEIGSKLTVTDSQFITMEEVVAYTKKIENTISDTTQKAIPALKKELETKANDNDVIALRKLATKNETDINDLGRDKVDKKDYSSLQEKVTSIEMTSSNLAQTKVNKTDLENYYSKNEVVGKIAEELHKIVGAAPEALDTLKELSEAINNNPNFGDNLIKELSNKVSKEDLAVVSELIKISQQKLAQLEEQKFLKITKPQHGIVFGPVFYSADGWTETDISQEMIAEGIAVKINENEFFVFFDGIITIPDAVADENGDQLSNGEYYFLSNIKGKITKDEYQHGIVQSLFKVINDNGVKKAFIILEQPIML